MIYGVAGLTRSGSSLCMGLLHEAGIPIFCEHECIGTTWETEQIKGLPWSTAWLAQAQGHAVKFLDPLRWRPPPSAEIRMLITTRNGKEQARSQRKLLESIAGIRVPMNVNAAAHSNNRDNQRMVRVLAKDFPALEVRFEDLISKPVHMTRKIARFIGRGDPRRMAALVRKRTTKNYPGLLEEELWLS